MNCPHQMSRIELLIPIKKIADKILFPMLQKKETNYFLHHFSISPSLVTIHKLCPHVFYSIINYIIMQYHLRIMYNFVVSVLNIRESNIIFKAFFVVSLYLTIRCLEQRCLLHVILEMITLKQIYQFRYWLEKNNKKWTV